MKLKILSAVFILSFLLGCNNGTTSPENPIQPLGGPFSEKASVKTDGRGNYMAVWKDGASIFSKYYPNGVGQTPFRVVFGEGPEFDIGSNGDAFLVYHRAEPDNRNIQNSFLKIYDVATQSWQSERFLSFQPRVHNFAPQVAVFDDLMLMTARVSPNAPSQAGGISYGHLATDLSTPLSSQVFALGTAKDPIFAPVLKMATNNQAIMAWSQQLRAGFYVAHFGYNQTIPSRSSWFSRSVNIQNKGTQLTTAPVHQGNYRLEMTADGDAIAAWIEPHPSLVSVNASSLWVSHFSAQTDEWTTVRISQNALNDSPSFDLSIDGQGKAHLFWENPNVGIRRSVYDPSTQIWNIPQEIHAAGNFKGITSYQTKTGNGGVIYSVDDEVYLSIYDLISDQWSAAELIGNGDSPDLAVDDKRECLAVWQDGGFVFEYQCSDVPLEVIIANNLGGKVVSDPVGIECGFLLGARTTNCKARYKANQDVTLIPTADSFFAFDSWSGDCSTSNPGIEVDSVVVTMDVAKNCSANFISTSINTALLIATKTGTGDGTVDSDLFGINCGANCSASFNIGETIVLTATENANSSFVSWGGTGDCLTPNQILGNTVEITLTQDSECIANFDLLPTANLTVSKIGQGNGTIVSDVPGINCGADCDEPITIGSSVNLTATPDANSTFTSWSGSGDCTNPTQTNGNQVTITVAQNSECIATFDPIATGNVTLTVIINGGPGAGEVNSTETPIPLMRCLNSSELSTTCSVSYPVDSGVTLVASLFFPNNLFFSTGCTGFVGANFDCFVRMDQDRTVTFDFGQYPTYDISTTVTGNGSIRTFGVGEIIFGYIACPSINCSDTFIVASPGTVVFEAHPEAGSTFVSWGVGQCDTEQVISGVGICGVNLTPGSPTTRQVDAVFQ